MRSWIIAFAFTVLFTSAVAQVVPGSPQDFYDSTRACVVPIETRGYAGGQLGCATCWYDYRATGEASAVLVTNRHMVTGQLLLTVGFNCLNKRGEIERLSKDFTLVSANDLKDPLWRALPDSAIDVAAIRVQLPRQDGECGLFLLAVPKSYVVPRGSLREGDDLLYFGYPLGKVGNVRNTPVLRKATIALVRSDQLPEGEFYIEGHATFGNSGGPVFRIADYWSPSKEGFAGIIGGFLSSSAVEIVESNGSTTSAPIPSGLSVVYDANVVQRTVDLLDQK
jgi:hypothetical protein